MLSDMTKNLTPISTTKYTEMFLCRDGIERPYNGEIVVLSITIERETREITFTGSVDSNHLSNRGDIVCRIGAGTKAHACDAIVWRKENGTFDFSFATVALNRTARVSGFASEIAQYGKSQHIGSKVN
jgi:hypothetical protein